MWPNVSSTITDSLLNSSNSLSPLLSAQDVKVEAMEAMVKEALRAQSDWSEAVTDRIVSTPGLPSGFAEIARQMHSAADNIFQLQSQLWDGWFRMVRGAGDMVATNVPAPVRKPAVEEPKLAAPVKAPVAAVEAALEEKSSPVEDDLRAISGIGPVLAEKLRSEGITSYRQVASWSDGDIERIEASIIPARFAGRIQRDGWIAQAKSLHEEKYGHGL